MKKVLALSLLCCLVLSMFACAGNAASSKESNTEGKAEQPSDEKSENEIVYTFAEFASTLVELSDTPSRPNYVVIDSKKAADKMFESFKTNAITNARELTKQYIATSIEKMTDDGYNQFIAQPLENYEAGVIAFQPLDEAFFKKNVALFIGVRRSGSYRPSDVKVYVGEGDNQLHVDIASPVGGVNFDNGVIQQTTLWVGLDRALYEHYKENIVITAKRKYTK